ncbi:MAG: 4a-hydroxytetrahydrobiopterin dehydratase [Thermoanaerobaculales bacterium]|nr:4a-hydroxytetrahydrobiopterin dehydratase [Thermoanaerobaculales bacterium]
MCDNTLVMEPCQAVPEGTPALSDHDVHHLLTHVDDWELVDGLLEKVFHFEDHYQTMAFVNAVAWISHREDHHPEMVIAYDACMVRYSTHTVDGLSRNDFLCAAKVDHLVEQ